MLETTSAQPVLTDCAWLKAILLIYLRNMYPILKERAISAPIDFTKLILRMTWLTFSHANELAVEK